MSVRTFPALGFDPAPGEPAALAAAAADAAAAARTLTAAAEAADRLDAGWQGEAAEAFRDRVDDLPRDLRHAAAAHGLVARELGTFAHDLRLRQTRADALERRAVTLRRAVVMASAAGPDPTRDPAGAPPPGADRSGDPAGAGSAGGGAAEAELAAVLADARRLQTEHHGAAVGVAVRIRGAADPPYQEPGLLARVRSGIERWVTRHADVLTSIAHGLRGVSATLGVMSMVPGFQFLTPVAIAAGLVAAAVDTAVLVATGRGSWSMLALDIAMTALPTGPVVRAVRGVPGMTATLRAVNQAIPAGVRGWVFRTARNLPEGVTAAQLAGAAARIRTGARDLVGDVVVQGSRAGHSARAGSDIDFGLRVPPDRYDELIEECFTRPGEARTHAVERGRIFWRRAGLKDLHDALQADLGRKVDLAIIKQGGRFDNEPWLRVP